MGASLVEAGCAGGAAEPARSGLLKNSSIACSTFPSLNCRYCCACVGVVPVIAQKVETDSSSIVAVRRAVALWVGGCKGVEVFAGGGSTKWVGCERAGGGELWTSVDGKLIWKVLNRKAFASVGGLKLRFSGEVAGVCVCDGEDTSAED